ncbi:MAG: phosphomannomutase/phosphoglucomutase [Desulfovibrionaceae bacterium]|nr:phosphomannomutase/phosphoglucomutase [Desulfovibrionaceae bacterium]
MTEINPEVFRAYDIRGLVGRDFGPGRVESLGRACGAYFRARGLERAVVGHDCRASSPGFQWAMVRGLTRAGVDVLFLGLVSTPMFYFAVKTLGLGAGVMVTASHNPPEFNGFKVWAGDSTIHSGEIQDIRRILEARAFVSGNGLASAHDIRPSYLAALVPAADLARPVKVVVDGGNGSGGEITAEVLERAGAEVVRLFCEPDGSFPNHHPDPVIEENMARLKAEVLKTGADFGVGLDGDGDRIAAVDERGRLMFGDELLALFARDALKARPGGLVLGDVKCSHLLFKDIEAHGGRAEMCASGHSLVKDRMRRDRALLAGEMSGHMFFADRYYGFDDACYAALRLAGIVSRSERPLSGLLGWPRTWNTPELRLACPEAIKFKVVEKALKYFKERYKVVDEDGARLIFPDGWGLVRASNTQPCLVLRFEAETPERLAEIRGLVEAPLGRWMAELENRT